MKAIVFDSTSQTAQLEVDRPLPVPAPGEVRLRVLLAGICNTDLEVLRGYAQFQGVMGHEFVGIVDQAEDPALVGQRVAAEINLPCLACETCRAGRYSLCPHRTALGIRGRDGALADYVCVPARNLHPLPDALPDEAAVFVEPLAAACEILEQVPIRPTDRVIVLGDGKLGLLIAQVLALTGCALTVVGRHREKLDLLAARGIATQLGDRELAQKADLVVECTGRAEGFCQARQMVRAGGTLILKSTYHGTVDVDLSGLVVDEIHLVGSRCGPFPAAIRLLSQGLVDVAPLIEAVYCLDEGLAALEHAGRKGALKVLVRP